MNLIEALQWRYATKQFDANKTITNPTIINQLKQAVQLASSSYGLQPYKVMIVSNQDTKNQLLEHSFNQQQITDASHLFVFCNYTKITEEMIDAYIKLTANLQQIPIEKSMGYGDFMKKALLNNNPEQTQQWTAKQCYIAMDSLLVACASLKIDACPMEGFQPEAYNKILNLDTQNLNACLVVPVGYRSDKDTTQHLPKVRKPINELFTEIN